LSSTALPSANPIITPNKLDKRENILAGRVEPEEYELVEYDKATQEAELRLSRTEDKRTEKRRKLEEADEMKFSHSIQFNAVPDWSSHYISYSNLKKLYARIPSVLSEC